MVLNIIFFWTVTSADKQSCTNCDQTPWTRVVLENLTPADLT